VTVNPEKLKAVQEWPPPADTQAEKHPWSVYPLLEIHSWIHGHHRAANSTHGREVDIPVVSRSRSHIPAYVGVVFGTVGIRGVLSQVQECQKHRVQEDSSQGCEELLHYLMEVIGCYKDRTLPQIPLWIRIPPACPLCPHLAP
jgi:hypothetical protein